MVYKYDNIEDIVDPELVITIIQLLWRNQKGKCAYCKIDLENYNIHHKKYGDDITLYDLELLCKKCHLVEHNKVMRKEPRKNNFIPSFAT